MGLRIATNIPALVAQRNLEATSRENGKSIARLSSGNRIISASDDAAGLAVSDKLNADIRSMRQAARNANDGISVVQTAEGSLNEVSNMLIRLRELAVQAASDTIGDDERGFLNKEHQALSSEIQRITDVTQFNGRSLLKGEGGQLSIQVGIHAGEDNMITLDNEEVNSSIDNLGIDGTSVETKSDALSSLASVDGALSMVNGFRAGLGAMQNRLHSASNNLGALIENSSEARSRIADTDIAEEASKLTKTNILQNAGISVLAQANAIPNAAMKLL